MDAQCRIELFGGLRVEQGGRVITRFRTQKGGALLAFLAYHLERTHPREALIELLWPEVLPKAGRNCLSVELSSLRHQLEPPGVPAGAVILADRTTVCLNSAAVTTDVAEFDAALRFAAEAESDLERTQHLADAVALYRGELLAGYYEDWMTREQDRQADAFFEALRGLIKHLLKSGDYESALRYARQGVSMDPLREEMHFDLMRVHAAAGNLSEALHQYGELELLLKRELEESPSAATRALAQQIKSRIQSDGDHAIDQASMETSEDARRPALTTKKTRRRIEGRSPSRNSKSEIPTGTVTFLLTDIQSSTALWEQAGEAFKSAFDAHNESLRTQFARHGGHEVNKSGDAFVVAFSSPAEALACAVACQRSLAAHPWPEAVGPLRVRMALHTGEVEVKEGDYHGLVLHHASRVLVAAHGGQILCGEAAAVLLRRDLQAGVRLIDLGAYRLRDVSTPERLFQVEYPDMAQREFPPLNAAHAHSSNIPLQVTRFFGREDELKRLQTMLLPETTRLVTLTGPGGSGKTRLALEAARRLEEAYQGAAWFVSLADHTDARLIVDAISDGMRLSRSTDTDPLDQVVQALASQPSLLLLDNFEQLVEEGAAIVATLLQQAPKLTCLVTSRHRLDVAGEQEFPVPPLPIPRGPDTPERLSLCESVQLFVDRAQAVRPDFQLTRSNAAPIAELCDRLEGIPLALELAASRAQVLTPSQMVQRLEQPFDLLAGRRRDVAQRHRTLRAAIDWSYQLLTPELQQFFERLSVFRDGWTLDSAEVVCNEPLALDYMAQLQECSLVTAEHTNEEARYRFLETLRNYAWERLVDRRESELLCERHCRYFLALAEESEAALHGPTQAAWLDRLEVEQKNLRAALTWAEEKQNHRFSIRLALSLYQLQYRRGFWAEARQYLEKGWEATGRLGNDARLPRAAIERYLASLAQDTGDVMAARRHAESSLRLYRALHDDQGIAEALNLLGLVAMDEGDPDAAQRYVEEALALLADEDHSRRGIVLHNLALFASRRGDTQEAKECYEESLVHRRIAGDKHGEAETLGNLGALAHKAGDHEEARRRYRESLAIVHSLGDRYDIAIVLSNLGELAEGEHDMETAVALYLHSENILQEVQSSHARIPADHLDRLAAQLGNQQFSEMQRLAVEKSLGGMVEAVITATENG